MSVYVPDLNLSVFISCIFWKLWRIFPFGPSFMTRTELSYWFKAGFSSILWEFFPCNAQKDNSTHTNLIKQNI